MAILNAIIFIICVAPFVGAWIEMCSMRSARSGTASLRSSERGLKCFQMEKKRSSKRRSVRRSVD